MKWKLVALSVGALVILVVVFLSLLFRGMFLESPDDVSITDFKVVDLKVSENKSVAVISGYSRAQETLYIHDFVKAYGGCANGDLVRLVSEKSMNITDTVKPGELYVFLFTCPQTGAFSEESSFDIHYHTKDNNSIRELAVVIGPQ